VQLPIYNAEGEMELMTKIWSPAIKDDPEAFVLFAYPWKRPGTPLEKYSGPRKWQREILRKLRDHIHENNGRVDFKVLRMAVASGRGIGKSALVSWLTHWMLSTRIGSTTIVSANSEAQLRSITWAEMTKWLAMAINSHWFEVAATRISPAKWVAELVERDLKKGTRYWAIEGRLWSEENPDAYAGLHNADGVLLIFDESSGIPDSIWDVAQGFFTENTPNRFWCAFSNPRRNEGYFFEAFHAKRNFWVTQNIDAREVEDTDKAVYQQIIDEYGENSPQAKIEVYGQFPDEGDDQFISPHIVDAAIRRDRYQDQYAPRVVGVDPARSGADSTVIVVRQGRDLVAVRRYQGEDTMATVGRVIDAIEEFRPALVVLDEGGLGYGILDRLKEQRYKVVRGVNFSWKSKTPAMYANKRAELWGLMRDWLQTASLPNDRQLKADLTAPHQKPNSTGSIQLESKKDMKSRGLPSPDAADALACTFAYPVAEREARTKERRISVYEGANGLHNSWLGA
jgi:hypothetical protein